jgi:hypothetical protein
VFSEKSNLKCALYGDIHTAAEKTNKGGQQSEAPPAGLTYIQHSSGWAAKTLADPASPPGYELVFGPTDGANNAPGVRAPQFIWLPTLIFFCSTWALHSLTNMMLTPVRICATTVVLTLKAETANTSTSGERWSAVSRRLTPAAWYVYISTLIRQPWLTLSSTTPLQTRLPL